MLKRPEGCDCASRCRVGVAVPDQDAWDLGDCFFLGRGGTTTPRSVECGRLEAAKRRRVMAGIDPEVAVRVQLRRLRCRYGEEEKCD